MDPRARSAAAWANLDRAKQMVQDGQAKEALTILKDFVISKPKEPEGYFWAGVAFDHSGQPTRALRAYMNSLTLSLDAGMDSAELRVNIGNALLKEGRVDEALTSFKRAVLIEPRLAIAHLSYARGLLEKGDAAEALVQLRRAADLNADSKQVSYYRLKALAKLGQKEEARAERKALIESTTDAVQKGKLQEEFKALD
jgi:protein O-GlcNAc transferase